MRKFSTFMMLTMLPFISNASTQNVKVENNLSINQILSSIDSMDSTKFAPLLSEDSEFKFGNFPPVVGKADIAKTQDEFNKNISGMKHEVKQVWRDDSSIVAEMNVTYTRLDGTKVTLPVTDVFQIKDNKITGTYIYMDIAPLFNNQ